MSFHARLLSSVALLSFACDSMRADGASSSDRGESAQRSTYRLEPPAPQPPRPSETQLAALATPGQGEKDAELGSASSELAGSDSELAGSDSELAGSDSKLASSGSPSPTCINGWSVPPRGSALRAAALGMMRGSAQQRFIIDEMRYFVGPEDAEVMSPQDEVERWYVKGYLEAEPQRRQRWLVRRARLGSGVDAVAPYESRGYGPKTWTRLDAPDEQLADPFEHPCDAARPDVKCMGLPPQVLGCLEGT